LHGAVFIIPDVRVTTLRCSMNGRIARRRNAIAVADSIPVSQLEALTRLAFALILLPLRRRAVLASPRLASELIISRRIIAAEEN